MASMKNLSKNQRKYLMLLCAGAPALARPLNVYKTFFVAYPRQVSGSMRAHHLLMRTLDNPAFKSVMSEYWEKMSVLHGAADDVLNAEIRAQIRAQC